MKTSAVAAIFVIVELVATIGSDSITKCNPELCFLVDCMELKPEQCDRNTEVFQKADNCRYCCDTCVTKRRPGNAQCDPPDCSAVLCLAVTEADCKPNEIFRPDGYNCKCCPRCERRPPCDPSLCDTVKCAERTKDDCKKGQIFRPKGYKCGCCAYCEDKRASIGGSVITGGCDFTTCNGVRCAPITVKNCTPNQIFRPRGYKCNCCAYCEDRPDDRACDRIDCVRVRCANIQPTDCTAGQIFLPADFKCRCCNRCVNRRGVA